MGDGAYSLSLTTFSPSGKLVQIEYALNAVASGATSLGVKGALPPCQHCQAARTLLCDACGACVRAPLARGLTRRPHPCYYSSSHPRAAKNGVVIATKKKVPSRS